LFVFNRSGMFGYEPTTLDHETPHGKIGRFLRRDEYLDGRLNSRVYSLRLDVT